uniref:Uncharacterized protein n=1 Tax=Rhizophora mucronata TaxID=61149 RepID=A0A2P2NM36_RHIMU
MSQEKSKQDSIFGHFPGSLY